MEEEKKTAEEKADTENKENAKEEGSKPMTNKTLLIAEACVAALAVIVIVVALILNKKKADPSVDPNAVPGTADPAAGMMTGEDLTPVEIDNSAVEAFVPQFPQEDTANTLTEEEAKANVEAGTMLRLDLKDGGYIYVNNYKNSEYLQSSLAFDDAEMEQYIKDEILAKYEVKLPVDRDTAEIGDLANIDYTGVKDGVAFEGGTAQGYDLLLGSGTFIPGFEDGVVGMKIGETKDLPLTFPENYQNADLAGASVVFTVKLNSLKTEGYASELTDDVASQLTGDELSTAAAFRDYIRNEYLPQIKLNEFLLKDLYVGNLTEEALRAQYDKDVEQYTQQAAMYGMSLDTYVSTMGAGTLDDFLTDIANSAADTLRAESLYEAIRDNEIAAVTDADIASLATEQGYTDAAEFTETYGRETIEEYLYQIKVEEYLDTLAGITAK